MDTKSDFVQINQVSLSLKRLKVIAHEKELILSQKVDNEGWGGKNNGHCQILKCCQNRDSQTSFSYP